MTTTDEGFFTVTYRLQGTAEEAAEKARDICLEQTVEFPDDLLPEPRSRFLEGRVVGRILSCAPIVAGADESQKQRQHMATIRYSLDTAAGEITQLFNVVFGNVSIKPGIVVERIDFPQRNPSIASSFRAGPRFGGEGLRRILGRGVETRPILATALKPMGLSARELADLAYKFALGNIDIIKDDHGLTDQKWAPFEERVRLCSEAVAKANAETGRHCLYAPNVTASGSEVFRRAAFAKSVGAGALLIAPLLTGFGTMHELARDNSIGLPILAHPAFCGTYCLGASNANCGVSHYALFGQLMRLAGADVVIFPSWGGRFSFSQEECTAIDSACKDVSRLGSDVAAALPAPAGGMTVGKVKEMSRVYGNNVVYLVGSGLFRNSPDVVKNCAEFHAMIDNL